MIKFGKLTIRNFLSIGEQPFEIDLSATRSTLVVGTNGAGKSTMLDALSYVLFSKPHRKINKPQLINSINNKDCLVTIEFSLGRSQYKIIRGMRPNIFEIWCNGKLINQESHSRDYQALLETNILKLNHKSFHQVVVLGSSNFTPFMQLTPYARREVIEDLLDIVVFSQMNLVLKERLAKLKDQISDKEHALSTSKGKIDLQLKHIHALEQIDQKNSAKILDEIADLQSKIEVLEDRCRAISNGLDTQTASSTATLKTLNDSVSKLNTYEFAITDKIKKVEADRTFYETNDVCPTCSQEINHDLKTKKIHECNDTRGKLDLGKGEILAEITKYGEQIQSTKSVIEKLTALQNEWNSNSWLITEYHARIGCLEHESLTDQSQKVQIAEANQTLTSLKSERDLENQAKIELVEDRRYHEACAELLKDSGIKTKIIKQYIPLMNKLINHYLQTLDFFVSFELDENFSETIRSRHRDDFSYASFSEGEKSRISLSILFAWREIARLKNSASTNLLILDEVFDSSLDNEGVDNLVKIMDSIQTGTNIFVITHKPDQFESLFDRKITVDKTGNFSQYTVEALK